MDKTKDTGTWLKFFKDAGIPTKTGASYAHIFVENRIHKDMLSDLTVDHLRLMGITLIGDVIAIQRHAKSVHQDSLRKVVILKSKDDPPESSSSSSSSSRSSSSSSSSSISDQDVEMVEITKPFTKKANSSTSKTFDPKIKKELITHPEESRKQIRSKVIDNNSTKPNKSNAGSDVKISNQPLKRKQYDDEQAMEEDSSVKKTVIKTSNPNTSTGRSILHRVHEDRTLQAAPVKRVSTENQLFGPKLPPPKKTIFDRLGAETSSPQVSSTTEVAKSEIETKFTRTIGNVNIPVEPVKIIANIDIPPPKASSVFNRLGEVTPEPLSALPYAGVLKSPPSSKKPTLNITKKIVTMRADEPEIPVKLRAATKPLSNTNIKLRVGETSFRAKPKPKLTRATLTKNNFVNPASEGIFANPKNALHFSAKERLGLQSRQKALNKSAKARLGLQPNQGKTINRQVNQRLKKFMEVKNRFGDEDKYTTRGEAAVSKKVSFGGVDRRLIPPLRSARGRNMKSGVHSRLGIGRFS